jgi:hypothetical protein
VKSCKTDAPEVDGGATRTFELDTAKEFDATTIFKRNLENSKKDDVNEEYKEVGSCSLVILMHLAHYLCYQSKIVDRITTLYDYYFASASTKLVFLLVRAIM